MKLRLMVGAFLTYGDEILLIHRGLHKKLAPGLWSCVGGHMEPGELNNPIATCYRETEEETGIPPAAIRDLKLRYITTRNTGDEIRTGYYFMGSVTEKLPLPECGEGSLHWVKISDITDLSMTYSIKQIVGHWLANKDCDSIWHLGINKNNDSVWTEL